MFDGQLVHESQARISVFDRSFLYGDGLFETLLIWNRRPFRWEQHWERLQRGLGVLRLPLQFDHDTVVNQITRLLDANQMNHGILRLQVSRGAGARGYSPPAKPNPVTIISTHPLEPVAPGQPHGWRLHRASFRLPPLGELASFKTCNKLLHVVARLEAHEHHADEALLLDIEGNVAEAAAGNLFWWADGRLHTPPLATGALPGVTRQVILELASRWKWETRETLAGLEQLRGAEGVFLTTSPMGVIEVLEIDDQPIHRSNVTQECHAGYWALVVRESEARRCAPSSSLSPS